MSSALVGPVLIEADADQAAQGAQRFALRDGVRWERKQAAQDLGEDPWLTEAGYGMAPHVAREFEGFLPCGDPIFGSAWLPCEPCDEHRLVTFSCKGRGFCPSCGGRRMGDKAAWLVDQVVPHVATRQWVLTVPWKRRWLLARNPDLANELVGIALDGVYGRGPDGELHFRHVVPHTAVTGPGTRA